jgi:uncharacterized repeat protein (TIGR04138 family)
MLPMPPHPKPKQQSSGSPRSSALEAGRYPTHAYEFIHEGLDHTVKQVYGPQRPQANESRHVSGQQLCEGLRELALSKWGRMACTVLRRWNITSTLDFGRIVFNLIEDGQMQKVEEDTLDDFKNVYNFQTAFEAEYRIPSQP